MSLLRRGQHCTLEQKVQRGRRLFVPTLSPSTVQQSAEELIPVQYPSPDLGTHASLPGHEHSYDPIVFTHSALAWHLRRWDKNSTGRYSRRGVDKLLVSRFVSKCTYRPPLNILSLGGKETETWLSTVLLLLLSRPLPLPLCLLSILPALFSPALSLHPVCVCLSLLLCSVVTGCCKTLVDEEPRFVKESTAVLKP